MKKKTRSQVSSLATATTLIILGLLAMITGGADAQETPIYKSIARDGSTVFTDQPAPEATVFKPAPLNVIDSPAAPPADTTPPVVPASVPADPAETTIDSVVIKNPQNEQTFIDPESQIWVEFGTSPASALPVGMTANLRLDDALVVTGSRYRMPVDVPERGTHRLQIQLVDQDGLVMAESEVINIHIKQHVAGSAN